MQIYEELVARGLIAQVTDEKKDSSDEEEHVEAEE